MEDEKSLQASALISQLPHAVQCYVNVLLTHSVVTSSIIVGSVFFATDQLFRVEELAVCACPHLI